MTENSLWLIEDSWNAFVLSDSSCNEREFPSIRHLSRSRVVLSDVLEDRINDFQLHSIELITVFSNTAYNREDQRWLTERKWIDRDKFTLALKMRELLTINSRKRNGSRWISRDVGKERIHADQLNESVYSSRWNRRHVDKENIQEDRFHKSQFIAMNFTWCSKRANCSRSILWKWIHQNEYDVTLRKWHSITLNSTKGNRP